jgi:multidrug efflux pump subunit AcrB
MPVALVPCGEDNGTPAANARLGSMWIVRLALRRPYTVATLCLVIALMGFLSVRTMRTDIFPEIDIPVVVVIWSYQGLSAEDMERRIVLITERAFSTTVNGITAIDSDSISGIGTLRVYFEPGTDIGAAIAQISSVALTASRSMPTGIQPPVVLQFNASNVPVAQLTMQSDSLTEQQLYDYGLNFVRMKLFTIPGLATPAPFGGASRQINVDIDLEKLSAKGLSPEDVVNAIQENDVIVPAGNARIGGRNYDVMLNGSPHSAAEFNAVPIKVVSGEPVLLGDVAHVYDGFAVQTNLVRVNGKRATYLAILRKKGASTLAVVDAAKAILPAIKATAPGGLELKMDMDQSVFVRGAVNGVLREAIISAGLVSLMVFVFLGSWRSMLIVSTSIPIAILVGVVGLFLTRQTLNIMTLGGLALAIGMLVDDATVEVENIHRNRLLGKKLTVAILDGAKQIAVPALAATLTICIVFFPVAMLTGPAKYLFIPLALSVVFSMLASYLLSRTLVPTMARMLMASEEGEGCKRGQRGQRGQREERGSDEKTNPSTNKKRGTSILARFNTWRDARFEALQNAYGNLLGIILARPLFTLVCAGLMVVGAGGLSLVVGTDFFPDVDAGLLRMHLRAPVGTRLEDTEVIVADVEQRIRQMMGADLATVTDSLGIPTSYNIGFVQTDSTGDQDADIEVSLQPNHKPTRDYMQRIRDEIPAAFPGTTLYFQPASIVERVLDFGLSAPIDVQIAGNDANGNMELGKAMLARISRVAGVADARIKQVYEHPAIAVSLDRQRAAYIGVTERDVANSLLTSLSSSVYVSPAFWLDPKSLVNYFVSVQTPIVRINTMNDISATPLGVPTAANNSQSQAVGATASVAGGSSAGAGSGQGLSATIDPQPTSPSTLSQASYLGSVATVKASTDRALISHHNVQSVVDIQCNVAGRDLGGVSSDIRAIIDAAKKGKVGPMPQGAEISLQGQADSMSTSFRSLALGLVVAIILVYLLMVVLFQSWLDPLIIIFAIPGALVGILWMLVITRTTLNVESLMGSIMAVGIAVSNSILLVSFANDVRAEKDVEAGEAALEAGKTRLRPVMMTALAMILGMLPMALGLGEGGEQNAPLGRAVIGGLLVATFATLFVVPLIYSRLRVAPPRKQELDEQFEADAQGAEGEEKHPRPVRKKKRPHTGHSPAGAPAT